MERRCTTLCVVCLFLIVVGWSRGLSASWGEGKWLLAQAQQSSDKGLARQSRVESERAIAADERYGQRLSCAGRCIQRDLVMQMPGAGCLGRGGQLGTHAVERTMS
jgi:hypothetical protein